MSHFLCCVAHTDCVSAHRDWQLLVSLGAIRERVTSHHHPEVFPGRNVMSMVGFLPPQSCVSPGVSSSSLSPPPSPSSVVPSTSGRAAQNQTCRTHLYPLQYSSSFPVILKDRIHLLLLPENIHVHLHHGLKWNLRLSETSSWGYPGWGKRLPLTAVELMQNKAPLQQVIFIYTLYVH